MAIPPDVFTTTLSKPVTPDALDALRRDVTRALERGAPAVLVDIDEVGTLDSPTIAGLIVLLRAARERGIALSLRVGRANLLETLRMTALDRIFPIVTPLEASRPLLPRSVRGARGRSVASLDACAPRPAGGFDLSLGGQKSA